VAARDSKPLAATIETDLNRGKRFVFPPIPPIPWARTIARSRQPAQAVISTHAGPIRGNFTRDL